MESVREVGCMKSLGEACCKKREVDCMKRET